MASAPPSKFADGGKVQPTKFGEKAVLYKAVDQICSDNEITSQPAHAGSTAAGFRWTSSRTAQPVERVRHGAPLRNRSISTNIKFPLGIFGVVATRDHSTARVKCERCFH